MPDGSISKGYLFPIFLLILAYLTSFLPNEIKLFLKTYLSKEVVGFIVGLYFFLYRAVTAQQVKSIKSINDLMLKINENCIEVFYSKTPLDEVAKIEKINMQLSFLKNELYNFPFGGAITSLLYTYSWATEKKIKTKALYVGFLTEITLDTIIESKSAPLLTQQADIQEKVSKIVHKSVLISNEIETNLKFWI